MLFSEQVFEDVSMKLYCQRKQIHKFPKSSVLILYCVEAKLSNTFILSGFSKVCPAKMLFIEFAWNNERKSQ